MMKNLSKLSALILGVGLSMTALATDPLAGTQWITYDKGQPKSIIKITETNHKLSGTIVKLLDPRATGKTYSMSATLNGTSLDVRGYIGVTVLGRTQTWQKK